MSGGYGSDSEEEQPDAEEPKALVKAEKLPLPDIVVKREVSVEAPVVIKQEEAPPWKGAEGEGQEEDVDYDDSEEDWLE